MRTFSAAVSDCFAANRSPSTVRVATMSPFHAAGPDVTVKVALTLEPAGTVLKDDVPRTTAFQRAGTARLSSTPVTAAPVVFVNVTVVSCDEPGENV